MLIPFLLLVSLVFAQQDITITSTAPVRTLARNVAWAGSGPSGFNNNYIFTPNPSFGGTCFSLHNNDVANHSFTMGVLGTADSSVTTYTSTPSFWNSQPRFTVPNLTVLSGPAVLADGTTSFYVATAGFAKIVLTLSNGTGNGTVSIFSVDQSPNEPCAGGVPNTKGALNGSGIISAFQCGFNTTLDVPFATTSVAVTSTSSSKSVVVCGFSIITTVAITTPGTIDFKFGTGASCGTNTSIPWKEFVAGAIGSRASQGTGQGIIFKAILLSDQLCIVNNGAAAGNVQVNLSYDYIP